jgi:fucose 4-O-acetylase-like acetyltransferase
MTAPGRIAAVDWIKAIAILAVVVNHAGPPPWHPGFRFVDWLIRYGLVVFHVPAFLLVAGFLYQRAHAIGWREIGMRLQRTWIPFAVASAIAWGIGLWQPYGWRDALWALFAAQTIGTYKFIAFLGLCIVLTWPISRLAPRALLVLLLAMSVLAVGAEWYGHLHFGERVLGSATGAGLARFCEFVFYPIMYFTIGWLVSIHRAPLLRLLERFQPAVLALSLAILALWLAATPYHETFHRAPSAARVVYSLSTVAGLVAATRRAPVPAAIQFLSDASLGIFLYHIMLVLRLQDHVLGWPPLVRLPVCLAASLACGVYVCVLARRILGTRARTWFGA